MASGQKAISAEFGVRAQAVKKVLESEDFYTWLKDKVTEQLMDGKGKIYVRLSNLSLKKRDAFRMEPVFARLRQDLPEVTRFSISNTGSYAVIHTTPDTLTGRFSSLFSSPGWVYFDDVQKVLNAPEAAPLAAVEASASGHGEGEAYGAGKQVPVMKKIEIRNKNGA